MPRSVSSLQWKVLRAVLRHSGTGGCPGDALRLVLIHRTNRWVHLTGLADAGLVEAVGKPAADTDGTPEPFRTHWRLTETGRQAAEYGEYEAGGGALDLPTPAEFTPFTLGDPPTPAKKKKGLAADDSAGGVGGR